MLGSFARFKAAIDYLTFMYDYCILEGKALENGGTLTETVCCLWLWLCACNCSRI